MGYDTSAQETECPCTEGRGVRVLSMAACQVLSELSAYCGSQVGTSLHNHPALSHFATAQVSGVVLACAADLQLLP